MLIVGGSVHELSQVKSQKDAIEQSKYDRALQEYLSTPTTGDLTILSDWTTRTSRNYLYIEGTVKNTSSKDVRYYEIGVKFLDRSGNVVDTDWTNGTDLDAGDSQRFEIIRAKNLGGFTCTVEKGGAATISFSERSISDLSFYLTYSPEKTKAVNDGEKLVGYCYDVKASDDPDASAFGYAFVSDDTFSVVILSDPELSFAFTASDKS